MSDGSSLARTPRRHGRAPLVLLAVVLPVAASCSSKRAKPAPEDSLAGLPYINVAPVREGEVHKSGVTINERDKTSPGENVFTMRGERRAHILSMDGAILHTYENDDAVPDKWLHVSLAPTGELYVISSSGTLAKLGWGSEVVWAKRGYFHHDVHLLDDGTLWTLVGIPRQVSIPETSQTAPILDDLLVHLTAEGAVLDEISVHALLGDRLPKKNLLYLARKTEELQATQFVGPDAERPRQRGHIQMEINSPFDVFHTNSIFVMPEAIPGLSEPGFLLISVRELDTVALVDPTRHVVAWSWGPGEIQRQHHATYVPDPARILLFDNGSRRGWSRVVEVDPLTNAVVWEYKATPATDFFSTIRGAAQRLDNGNTLITESDRGRAFEVTRDGRIVWEYFTAIRPSPSGGDRGAVYRVTRHSSGSVAAMRERALDAAGPAR